MDDYYIKLIKIVCKFQSLKNKQEFLDDDVIEGSYSCSMIIDSIQEVLDKQLKKEKQKQNEVL